MTGIDDDHRRQQEKSVNPIAVIPAGIDRHAVQIMTFRRIQNRFLMTINEQQRR